MKLFDNMHSEDKVMVFFFIGLFTFLTITLSVTGYAHYKYGNKPQIENKGVEK